MSLDTRGEPRQPGDRSDVLADRFYWLYTRVFDDDGDFVQSIDRKLSESRMADNVELFLSRAIGVGMLVGLLLWLVGTGFGYLFLQLVGDGPVVGVQVPDSLSPVVDLLTAPTILLVSGLLFGSIGFAIGFGALVSVPYFRAGARERDINRLMADATSFMYALSIGGMNQIEIMKAMAQAEDTYGAVSEEFQSIVLETEYFDTDYRTAIRNEALETPSDELSQFLTDMLSIVNSGGDMTNFLEDQKDKHMRTAKQQQQKQLDTLELFGEMYMTLSLFPLLLIIILVIMSMMSGSQDQLLMMTVYGLIPLIGVGFLILVSTVTQDNIGDGYLRPGDESDPEAAEEGIGVFNPGLIERYTGDRSVFTRIRRREGTHELIGILRAPHHFFRDHPKMVLVVTAPLTLLALLTALVTDNAPLSMGEMQDNLLVGTFVWVYMPLYLNLLPLAIFHEWNVRSRHAIVGKLSENLRKLASANDTGMTILESFKIVSDTSSGKLADEFETIHSKVNYGTSLSEALREFNNKYHIPRLARTVKLISRAQETSSQIQDVLTTAATASENQDDIDRDRKTRTRMQMVIIIMTYLTLLAVMALLQVQFLDTIAGLSEGEGGGDQAGDFGANLDAEFLSMLFFHAVTLQALVSSFIAGYIRNVDIISGVKYAVGLATVALVTWIVVEQLYEGSPESAAATAGLVGAAGRASLVRARRRVAAVLRAVAPGTGRRGDRTTGR